jgi:GNAT superfamily N-acetyltransferase
VTGPADGWSTRRADRGDIEAVLDLRALMFSAMGVPGVEDPAWRAAARTWLAAEIEGHACCVVLAVDATGRVGAGAMGGLRFETPSPVNPNGVWGLVNNVATHPGARRRGLARACVEGVLAWFRDDTEASVVELFATGEGAGLYTDLGFAPTAWPAMRLRLDRS